MVERRDLLCTCIIGTALHGSAIAVGELQPIEVSDNGRFLQKADGSPFFWSGDTAWDLQRLTPAEVEQYMANRAAKGFTVIQGPIFLSGTADYAGRINTDPTNPNEGWFQHMDLIIDTAAAHGLYVTPVIAKNPESDVLTEGSAYTLGHYVGSRYRQRTNIAAFMVGHEFNYPTPRVEIWTQVAQGVQDGLGPAYQRLLTAHPAWMGGYEGQSTAHHLHEQEWLSFNTIQSSLFGDCTNNPDLPFYLGVHNWMLVENDHARTPVKPVFDSEATYEMMNPNHADCDSEQPRWDAFGVRRRAYWSIFAGGFGHTYGANGVFQMHKEEDPRWDWAPLDYWQVAMDYPGASQMEHLRRLMESRPFFTRMPDQELLVTEPSPDVPLYIAATRDALGSYAFVYIPRNGHTLMIDVTPLSGSVYNAWWYEPASGDAQLIGSFDEDDYGASGHLSFTTAPSGEDWVLVIDDASHGFGSPGEPLDPCDCSSCDEDLDGDGTVGFVDLIMLSDGWGACSPCTADIDGDGVVGLPDLIELLMQWGPCVGCAADIDGDGIVGFSDLVQLVIEFDTCAPECPADIDGGGVGFSDLILLMNAWGDC